MQFNCKECHKRIDTLEEFLWRPNGDGTMTPYHKACVPTDGVKQ